MISDKEAIEWGFKNGLIPDTNVDEDDTITIDCLKGIYELQHGKLEVLNQKKDNIP